VSTHAAPHAVRPAVHPAEQVPRLQSKPDAQALPHSPQFCALVWVFTQAEPQVTWGAAHAFGAPLPFLSPPPPSELQLDAAITTASSPNNNDTTLFPGSTRWSLTRPILHHGADRVEGLTLKDMRPIGPLPAPRAPGPVPRAGDSGIFHQIAIGIPN
jgi:hypothetical protein